MEEWKEYKLGDIVKPVKDRIDASVLDKDSYISTENMLPNKSGITTSSGVPSGKAVRFQEGDVLISNIRPYFKKIWRADFVGGCSADVICLRASNRVEPFFLFYLLSQDVFFDYVMQGAKGTKMPRGDRAQIMQWPIILPPLNEQKQIATIFKSLDDKIECNRRINENLEQQAQALFKSWEEGVTADKHHEVKLDSIADFIGGYSYKGNELRESRIAMSTIKNFDRNGGFKLDGYKEIIPSDKVKPEHYAELFDILVAHTDLTQNAEVVGNAEIVLSTAGYKSIIFSMDLVKVLPKKDFPYRFFIASLLRNSCFKSHCMGYVNGTTVLHMSKKALPEFVFNLPIQIDSVKKIDKMLASIYGRMATITEENIKLSQLRDTLLPRLMSGELKVEDVKK